MNEVKIHFHYQTTNTQQRKIVKNFEFWKSYFSSSISIRLHENTFFPTWVQSKYKIKKINSRIKKKRINTCIYKYITIWKLVELTIGFDHGFVILSIGYIALPYWIFRFIIYKSIKFSVSSWFLYSSREIVPIHKSMLFFF